MRKLASITLIVIFSSIYYYSTVKNENSLAFELNKKVKSAVTHLKAPTKTEGETSPHTDSAGIVKQEDFGVDLGSLSEAALYDWLQRESMSMNMTNNDTTEVEVKLKASANTLKPEQVKMLSAKVLDLRASANERILAAYMLTLNSSEASFAAQLDLAKEPLPDLGPVLPHSEAELKHAQELALRYMEVDQLFERAKTDANILNKLKLLATNAGSEEVRRYIARKLKDQSL